ncbi:hypothetical protein KP509_21G040300 [Ceratopteris richardii]|uniref:BHLH domain-containing protein n=1 Tax=Ceratopteris richardii TaxID=49495 RepID=A0A8T2SC13_CERRI|nr:hypothetical protein KP509_21G040300 [Ceratopteris richardii]
MPEASDVVLFPIKSLPHSRVAGEFPECRPSRSCSSHEACPSLRSPSNRHKESLRESDAKALPETSYIMGNPSCFLPTTCLTDQHSALSYGEVFSNINSTPGPVESQRGEYTMCSGSLFNLQNNLSRSQIIHFSGESIINNSSSVTEYENVYSKTPAIEAQSCMITAASHPSPSFASESSFGSDTFNEYESSLYPRSFKVRSCCQTRNPGPRVSVASSNGDCNYSICLTSSPPSTDIPTSSTIFSSNPHQSTPISSPSKPVLKRSAPSIGAPAEEKSSNSNGEKGAIHHKEREAEASAFGLNSMRRFPTLRSLEITHKEYHPRLIEKTGKRKRKRTQRSRKNKEELESQRMTHIAVERNRRRQMNQHLNALKSLMPSSYIQRGDQASIVGGAIRFVEELEQVVQSLRLQKQMKECALPNTPSKDSCLIDQPPLLPTDTYGCSQSSNVNVEVHMPYPNSISARIIVEKRPRQLFHTLEALRLLSLKVLQLNITSLETTTVFYLDLQVTFPETQHILCGTFNTN